MPQMRWRNILVAFKEGRSRPQINLRVHNGLRTTLESVQFSCGAFVPREAARGEVPEPARGYRQSPSYKHAILSP